MKKLFTLLFILSFFSLDAQKNTRNVIISKVTADWCPNCGTWGWSFMDALKEEFSDGSAILLGVHHSGGLENPVSNWFANNLGNTYQPQFFVNNARFNVISGNWQQKVQEIKDEVEITSEEVAGAFIEFGDTYVDGNQTIHTSVLVTPDNLPTAEYYFGIYLFENNVEWYQANQSQNAMHPFVLRDVMAEEYYGDIFTPGLSQSGAVSIDKSYLIENSSWDSENIGLLAILWKKDGNKYIIENSQVIYNVGLLSSTENILDKSIVTIKNWPETIEVLMADSEVYNIMISNQQGQNMYKNTFESRLNISTSDYASGLYIVTIQSADGYLSKKLVIAK